MKVEIAELLQQDLSLRFGHGQIKRSAEETVRRYGIEWTKKYPKDEEAKVLKRKLRNTVLAGVPDGHSNKDMVWYMFRRYATSFHESGA